MGQIWSIFGRAQVDLFVSLKTTHCPLWFSLTHPAPLGLDAMVQMWPRLHLAFPPIALLPGVLERIHRDGVQPCTSSPVLAGPSLVLGPRVPSRWVSMGDSDQERPSDSGGWHDCSSSLELWKLWVWPLRGHKEAFPKFFRCSVSFPSGNHGYICNLCSVVAIGINNVQFHCYERFLLS